MNKQLPQVLGVPTESVRHLLQVIDTLASYMDTDQGVHMREHLLATVRSLAQMNDVDEQVLLDNLLYK